MEIKLKRINALNNFLEIKLQLIEEIKNETMLRIARFLKKLDIHYGYLIDFLREAKGYPGNSLDTRLIVDKFLRNVISEKYKEIQRENLAIKYVYNSIFNQIF